MKFLLSFLIIGILFSFGALADYGTVPQYNSNDLIDFTVCFGNNSQFLQSGTCQIRILNSSFQNETNYSMNYISPCFYNFTKAFTPKGIYHCLINCTLGNNFGFTSCDFVINETIDNSKILSNTLSLSDKSDIIISGVQDNKTQLRTELTNNWTKTYANLDLIRIGIDDNKSQLRTELTNNWTKTYAQLDILRIGMNDNTTFLDRLLDKNFTKIFSQFDIVRIGISDNQSQLRNEITLNWTKTYAQLDIVRTGVQDNQTKIYNAIDLNFSKTFTNLDIIRLGIQDNKTQLLSNLDIIRIGVNDNKTQLRDELDKNWTKTFAQFDIIRLGLQDNKTQIISNIDIVRIGVQDNKTKLSSEIFNGTLSTHTAADVWTSATRTLTSINWNIFTNWIEFNNYVWNNTFRTDINRTVNSTPTVTASISEGDKRDVAYFVWNDTLRVAGNRTVNATDTDIDTSNLPTKSDLQNNATDIKNNERGTDSAELETTAANRFNNVTANLTTSIANENIIISGVQNNQSKLSIQINGQANLTQTQVDAIINTSHGVGYYNLTGLDVDQNLTIYNILNNASNTNVYLKTLTWLKDMWNEAITGSGKSFNATISDIWKNTSNRSVILDNSTVEKIADCVWQNGTCQEKPYRLCAGVIG